MGEKPDIAELAVAFWRMGRWLNNLNAERKMAAKKSLREMGHFLEKSGVEIIDPLGWKFDPGLAIEVVNNEDETVDEDELIIIQTNSPIVKQYGSAIQYGRVVLGSKIKKQKPNNEIRAESVQVLQNKANTEHNSISSEKGRQEEITTKKTQTDWVGTFDSKETIKDRQTVSEVESKIQTKFCLLDENISEDSNTSKGQSRVKETIANQRQNPNITSDSTSAEMTHRTISEMSDKEFEKIRKKNIVSYNMNQAIERGLIPQIHGRKRRR